MNQLLQQIVDGEYEISPEKQYFRDGGTIGFGIRGSDGKVQYLYLDRRMNSATPDEFYLGAYPDNADESFCLGSCDDLVAMLNDERG